MLPAIINDWMTRIVFDPTPPTGANLRLADFNCQVLIFLVLWTDELWSSSEQNNVRIIATLITPFLFDTYCCHLNNCCTSTEYIMSKTNERLPCSTVTFWFVALFDFPIPSSGLHDTFNKVWQSTYNLCRRLLVLLWMLSLVPHLLS
jgi:hypothetical protein